MKKFKVTNNSGIKYDLKCNVMVKNNSKHKWTEKFSPTKILNENLSKLYSLLLSYHLLFQLFRVDHLSICTIH